MDQPTSIAQPGGSGLGWDAAESLALSELAPFAWRSQLAVRLGGVAWRSGLAESDEWINKLRSDSREVLGRGGMRPTAWRSLIGAL